MPLPRCFFDVSINSVPSGRIIFELFKDDCPKTAENFRCLCTGEKGEGRTTFKPLHYKGTPIHRIVKGFIIQGGDFSNGDGTGGESIYGGMFKDEGFKHKHDQPYLLSMANKGPHTNGSQFFITTRPAPHLDGIHVVFGRVLDGTQFVSEMENQKVDVNHRPYADVRITHCGELVLLKKNKAKKPRVEESSEAESSDESSSEDSSSESESDSGTDSEEERRRRRRRKRKKKKMLEKKLKEEERKKRRLKKKLEKKARREERKARKKKHSKKLKEIEIVESSAESGSESPTNNSYSEREPSEREPMVTSTVPELIASAGEEIPLDLRSNRTSSWLYRRSRTPSPSRGLGGGRGEERGKRSTSSGGGGGGRLVTSRGPVQSYKPNIINRKNEVSQSGRKLKGRGQMRYKTPPRFGESDDLRSELHSRNDPPPARNWDRTTNNTASDSGRFSRVQRSRSRSRERDRGWQDRRRPFREQQDRRGDRWSRFDRRSGEGDNYRRGARRSRWDNKRSASRSDNEQTKGDNEKARSDNERTRSSPRRDRTRAARSRSRSRSPTSRGRDRRSRQEEGRGGAEGEKGGAAQSKWARHKDGKESSSDEDKELERVYQNTERKKAAEEDVFGLDKLLT